MSSVVDASLLVAALVDTGDEGRWAEAILAEGDPCAPTLVRVEATNVLRRLEAAGRLPTAAATAAHQDLLRLDLHLFPFEPLADRVWALRANLTAYDACYAALAEALSLPLATLDRRLAGAPGVESEVRTPPT